MYNANDFLYTSGYLLAVLGRAADIKIVDKVVGARDIETARRIVTDYAGGSIGDDTEKIAESIIGEAYKLCYETSPHHEPIDIFAYKYICQNIKTALKKCYLSKETAEFYTDDIYYDFTSVSPEDIEKALRDKDFYLLPPAMAGAISEAVDIYARSGDPQMIDLLMDRACLEDMRSSSESFGCDLIIRLIRAKIDIFNIISFIRCTRMKKDFSFLEFLLADGGSIASDSLKSAYGESLDGLYEILKKSDYESAINAVGEFSVKTPIAVFERAFDNAYNKLLSGIALLPFGPELIVSYLAEKEKEATNLQIALTCKNVGLDNNETQKLLRV